MSARVNVLASYKIGFLAIPAHYRTNTEKLINNGKKTLIY